MAPICTRAAPCSGFVHAPRWCRSTRGGESSAPATPAALPNPSPLTPHPHYHLALHTHTRTHTNARTRTHTRRVLLAPEAAHGDYLQRWAWSHALWALAGRVWGGPAPAPSHGQGQGGSVPKPAALGDEELCQRLLGMAGAVAAHVQVRACVHVAVAAAAAEQRQCH